MPRNDYLWLATLALIAAKNLKNITIGDHDDNQGGHVMSRVTAIVGVISNVADDSANDLNLFLIVLCQIMRKTAHSPSSSVQIQILPVFLRIPRGVWAHPAFSRLFPGAKTITSPQSATCSKGGSHLLPNAELRFSCLPVMRMGL
ncbi:hypothetical protein ETQ85_07555 [Zoogloea oleivorans]|uniref:Uncharacterized protein n=1 Tax=Zoogloea oleivorans TaxID=1552750 RepID=A0A6C2D0C6_9RHOO|nr:hypothetical protein [Zoogloea oleivorans]TYC59878.1 hypothetical protein ETQ85_07555 [Zoogloea oleivorans]